MTKNDALLAKTKLFVLDMDGTFYLGNQILPGAAEFLRAVKAAGKDYLFFTNNSSRSPRDYMAKLAGMGCPITRDQIMTSGDVTIRYLQTHYPDKTVYLVGTPPLVESFTEAGIRLVGEKPDIVVVGFDTTLTYEKLSKYLGKPFAETVEMVLDKTGYAADEVAFVGDRLYTDVATGVKNGAAGILVLTGETHLEDVPASDVQPDAIFASLGEMGQQLCQL